MRFGCGHAAAHLTIGIYLLTGALAGPSDNSLSPDRARLIQVVREIQNVCFASFPDELVRSMSGREGPVPDEVRNDPKLRQGYLNAEETGKKGLFYPSLLDDLLLAFEATVRPEMKFVDLGSGDGRVVFLAAHLEAHATGIEYDRRLHRIARKARKRLTHLIDRERAVLRRGDFFEEDLGEYDILFYFGKSSFSEGRLLRKIMREMRSDAVLLLSYPSGLPRDFGGRRTEWTLRRIGDYGAVQAFMNDRP